MSLHSDTLSWFQANQSLLLLLNVVCLVDKQQIPIVVFDLFQGELVLKPTIYYTQSKHSDHYTPLMRKFLIYSGKECQSIYYHRFFLKFCESLHFRYARIDLKIPRFYLPDQEFFWQQLSFHHSSSCYKKSCKKGK